MMPLFVFPLVVIGFLLLVILKTRLRLVGALMIAVTFVVALALPGERTPSILIAESGDLIGLIGSGRIATNRERPPAFIFAQWRRALAISSHQKPVVLRATPATARKGSARRYDLDPSETEIARKAMEAAFATSEPNRFTCQEKMWCIARYRPGAGNDVRLVYAEDAAFINAACQSGDIVVTPVRLRQPRCFQEAGRQEVIRRSEQTGNTSATDKNIRLEARLFTAATLSRSGSIAIHLNGDTAHQMSLKTARGDTVRPWTLHRLYDWRSDSFLSDADDPALSQVSDTGE